MLCGASDFDLVQFKVIALSLLHSDYFEDYGQNQISAIQFSPNGLHLTLVTDDRSVI